VKKGKERWRMVDGKAPAGDDGIVRWVPAAVEAPAVEWMEACIRLLALAQCAPGGAGGWSGGGGAGGEDAAEQGTYLTLGNGPR